MKIIDAADMDARTLNEGLRECKDENVTVRNCLGQRYLASGAGSGRIVVEGIAGNALGAYLNGAAVRVKGNAQEATGDTMNDGEIIVEGNSGDATGYAMRGGRIYVRGNAGYRAGIHMKSYNDKIPVLVIGGSAGDFLGEYQAGGIIIVLGIGAEGGDTVGSYCGTGMHGGKIFIRSDRIPAQLPKQVIARDATPDDLKCIKPILKDFAKKFDLLEIEGAFKILTPDTKNPYRQMYVNN